MIGFGRYFISDVVSYEALPPPNILSYLPLDNVNCPPKLEVAEIQGTRRETFIGSILASNSFTI